jgi:hypothetical protein
MIGERPKAFGEAFGFGPITSTLICGEYDAGMVDAMMRRLKPRLWQIGFAPRKLGFRETNSISERRTK